MRRDGAAQPHGMRTLESLAAAPRLNAWIIEQFPEASGVVLDAGCGLGSLADRLVSAEKLILVDFEPAYVDHAVHRLAGRVPVVGLAVDLGEPGWSGTVGVGSCDAIYCINVLEHVEADDVALSEFRKVLRAGGRLNLLVPAHGDLFSPMDSAIGHFRRYDEASLRSLMERHGFHAMSVLPFNRLGVLGWRLNRIMNQPNIGRLQSAVIDAVVPIARAAERHLRTRGLSWLVHAEAH